MLLSVDLIIIFTNHLVYKMSGKRSNWLCCPTHSLKHTANWYMTDLDSTEEAEVLALG